MTYRIAVCDDNAVEADYILSLVREWGQSAGNTLVSGVFPSAEAFLFEYEEQKVYDILLLDIEMNGMNGIELAKKIRRSNDAVQIVFVTGYLEYIAEGYEVAALHYLMKPVDREKLFSTLDRAASKLKRNERALLVEMPGETLWIPLYEIRFLEVRQNYVTIYAKQEYTVKRTLGEIEKDLDERFFRTGRSYIINLTCIRRVTKKDIFLTDGSQIPLPRGKYDELNRAIIART